MKSLARRAVAIQEITCFLLSLDEVESLFPGEDARRCAPTEYAIEQGMYVEDEEATDVVYWTGGCGRPASIVFSPPMSTATAWSIALATLSTTSITPFVPLCG